MRFQCEHCEQIVSIDDSECGKSVGCGYCRNVTMVPNTRLSPKALISDFVIRGTLGSGGMGTVYLAHQMSLDRPVALKILLDQFAHNSEFIVDFVREARAAARLTHPNIVQSFAVGEDEGIYFFAMEYVEGETLKEILSREQKLEWESAVKIIEQIADALDFAWKNQQLVHRDIKPDNIMLTKRNIAKLADLGLARAATETSDDDDEVMGTPQYICPEQLLGQPMDVRGDIYSLGATLFHAVTGNFPYEGNSAADIARKHLNAPIPEPRDFDPNVPAGVSYVIKRMMAKRLEDRYEDAEELVVDLGLILRNQKPVGMRAEEAPKKKSTKTKLKTGRLPAVSAKSKSTGRFTTSSTSAASTGSQKVAAPPKQKASSTGRSRVKSTAAAAPTTGDPSTMSSGKKIKSTRIKSTRSAAAPPAAAENKPSSPASSSYRRPGSPPAPVAKKKGGIPASVIILIVVIVFILGMVGWFVSQLMKYGFKTAEENHSYYLFQVANTGEREAYQSLINHSKTEYTLSQAEDVLAEANQFLKDYPSSLFAREPSTLKTTKQWAILYQVPLEMELLADKLPGTGQPWVAEIRDLRNTLFRQKFILHCRKQDMEAEQTTIEKNAAIFDFQQEKIKVWNELRDFSDGFMRRYEQRARELSSQMQSNLGAFQTEKQTVREKIINSTTQCDSDGFDTAKLFLRRALAEAAWLQAYPKRVKNGATAMLSQAASETNEVQSKLAEFKRRFIKHEKGGKVELSELKDSFEANIESRYKAARALIANLPAQERDLKRDREQWLKDYTTAVESAEAYFELVAGTGTKFGPGWDEKHIKKMDSDKNLSNIGTEMAKRYPRTYIDILYNGWQPNSQIKVRIEDVQVWVQSVSKEKVIVQFRAFDNRGVIVPKGTDSIPHWHAVHLGLFHYFAKQVKDENFENNYLCFEFFVRPTWFKKMTEAGGGGASVDFLKGEVDKIVPLWKPEWAKQLVHETKRGIVKNPLKRRKALATQLRDVLGTTEAYQSESEWFQKLFSME